MRRLPVYLLIDTSGSMKGEPIEAVKVGIQSMISALRKDPFALESVQLSILTFDRDAKILMPLTDIESFQLPEITTPDSGPTHLGQALELLCNQFDSEVLISTPDRKGDWKPLLFVMTDGSPSDKQRYKNMVQEVKRRPFGSVIACAAGEKAKCEDLKTLADHVVTLDTTDSATFQKFFQWVSASVSVGNQSMGATSEVQLPPPPEEVRVVI